MAAIALSALLLGASAAAAAAAAGRAELHVHLDGSVDVGELYQICRTRRLRLPGGIGLPGSPEDVRRYIGTHPGWTRFDVVNDIIGGDAATIRAVAEAFVGFQARSGVRYTEVRYDPVRLARSSLAGASIPEEEAVEAVREGLTAGAARFGVSAYQILCAMRGQSSERCLETAHLAAKTRSHSMGGVVGLDLAGDEARYPNAAYVHCFRHAKHVLGLNTTVHAGEATTAVEVRSAVLEMGADRVGHGYSAVGDADTVLMLRERRVHLEACPASARSEGVLGAIGVFRTAGLRFGLNTDDPASFIENTTAAEDEAIVKAALGFSDADVRRAYEDAVAAAFGPAVPMPMPAEPAFVI